jgi:2'-5' RNA ligase
MQAGSSPCNGLWCLCWPGSADWRAALPAKSGIFVIAEIKGPAAKRIRTIQKRFDPRLAREWPPHVTLAGSSGMGPIESSTPIDELRARLEPIARETPPLLLAFGHVVRFMQTNIIVLPLNPHGPLRQLHERVKLSGLRFDPPRFYFTPHVTLSFYPEHPPEKVRELLAISVPEPADIEAIQVYHTRQDKASKKLFELPLVQGLGP